MEKEEGVGGGGRVWEKGEKGEKEGGERREKGEGSGEGWSSDSNERENKHAGAACTKF